MHALRTNRICLNVILILILKIEGSNNVLYGVDEGYKINKEFYQNLFNTFLSKRYFESNMFEVPFP